MTPLGLRRKTAYSILLVISAWVLGFGWFLHSISYYQLSLDPTLMKSQRADAVIVLTGGNGRLEHGLRLLARGRAPLIFVSGAGRDVRISDIIRLAPPEVRAAIAPRSVILGHEAENTIGNAEEISRWLKKNGFNHIILVTSDYHMPRALQEVWATAPELRVTPAAVSTQPMVWALIFSEYHKYLASKLRHLFVSVTDRL